MREKEEAGRALSNKSNDEYSRERKEQDMKAEDILACVDHTLLKPMATWEEIIPVAEEAIRYHMATVMVPSSFVAGLATK